MTLPFPKGVLAQHTILLGKTRSGKSSTMRVMVEDLLDDKKPVCIIDPKGDWWGIKSSADGKKPGYDVVIFGGSHADVPINPQSGKVVAELVATGNRPALIDLGGWMVGDRTRFFIDFASTLFVKTHGHRWLAIDECHNFAPQGKVIDPQAGMSLHWANRLASEGAGKGLVLISASQRPQKVHKDYLTSHETLIGKRVIHKLDRDALKDWIDACGDPEQGKEVLRTLAGLQRSQGWVYSPEIEFGPKLVDFPMFKTYDSFKPQTGVQGRKLKGWASVDLDQVKEKLAAVVEEAKANDPKELRAEVARLKGEIAKLQSAAATPAAAKPDKDAIAAAEKRGFDQAQTKLKAASERAAREIVSSFLDELSQSASLLQDAVSLFKGNLKDKTEALRRARPSVEPVTFTQSAAAPVPRAVSTVPPQTSSRAKPATPNAVPRQPAPAGDGSISGPQAQLLQSLRWWDAMGHNAPSRVQVATICGWKITSGHLKNVAGSLKSRGLIDYPSQGTMALTEEGAALAPAPNTDTSLVESVRAIMTGPQRQAFDILPPDGGALTREQLAEAVGWNITSGHVKNVLGSMRSLEVIEYPGQGMVARADWLRAA